METWFTSDTHFFHTAVIGYCHRPFASLEDMNNSLVDNWNACVKPHDEIIHIGDFSFGGSVVTEALVARLNGKKKIVLGNHDMGKPNRFKRWGFEILPNAIEFEGFILSHFPYKGSEIDLRVFENQLQPQPKWLLHGHVHCAWKAKEFMINVGVDVWGYKPVHFDELKRIRDEWRPL